MKLQYKHI